MTNEYTLLSKLLVPEKEIVTFPLNRLEELPLQIKDLLEHEERAAEIAEAGYQKRWHIIPGSTAGADRKMDGRRRRFSV